MLGKWLLASAVSLQAFSAASAQTGTDASQPEIEVVVTGSRLRPEAAQDTPIAVSVLPATQLEALHSVSIAALSGLVPNLTLNETGTSPGLATISLRGFNTRNSDISSEPGVAVYVDGVYQTTSSGSLADLYDVERLEVLRGPQGSLLGKNSGAGAILLSRTRPTGEFGGRVGVEYGSYNLAQVQALVNFPVITDVLAAKVTANFRRRDDWVDNVLVPGADTGGEKRGSVRGALLFTPSADFKLYLTADYIWDRSSQAGARNVSPATDLGCVFFGVCNPGAGRRGETGIGFTAKPTQDENNVTANAEWVLGGVKLTSITGYRHYETVNNVDLDMSPFPILEVFDSPIKLNQFSQELRLSSEKGGFDLDGRLTWLIAGYYGHSNGTMTQRILAFGAPSPQQQKVIRDSYALFGHADFDVTDELTVSVGGRRSWDKVKHAFGLPGTGEAPPPYIREDSEDFKNTSFELGAQYKFAPGKMAYVRYAEGYRGGGFVGLPGSLAAAVGFDPETSESYELGLKTSWLDDRLTLNLTLFETKFKNLQRDIVGAGPNNTFIQIVANAADATTKGVELEASLRPVRGLTLSGNVGYLDAKYQRYQVVDAFSGATIDLSGQPLTYAPKWTASGIAEYRHEVNLPLAFDSLTWRAKGDWRDNFQMSNSANPVGLQDAYAVVDLSLAIGSGKGYSLTLYANNVFDKRFTTLGENVSGLISFNYDNIGRTVGAALNYEF
ncbi:MULTISPECIES: TonB-dependent receptor [Sphingobium]|uniref:TonB-dependent receptor n=1 Tax=Sphingobium sp. MI1205 TaxID=407020 RepID=UPI00077003CC|nr:TonB-dependent receptor [Sphingobium sp. MI1205]AMK19959.1 TonB-dependent receptor [Sphingobium sp. MI1205]